VTPSSERPRFERPRLLFAARRPPFPLVTGARIRTHRLLTALAQSFDTTFVTFEHDARSADGHVPADELRQQLPGIDTVIVPGCGPGKRLRQLASVARRGSWEYGRYDRQAMREMLERLVHDVQPDLVHFDDLGVAQFGPLRSEQGTVNVYSAHNVEYRILVATVENAHTLRRQFARLERRKVETLERRVWRMMNCCLACSEHDAAEMRAGGATVILCPNGADPVTPLAAPTRGEAEPLRLLFVGAVDYRPNQLGLEWFITEVLPGLRRRLAAGVVVDVVGSPPRHLEGKEQVSLHGRVPSVAPFYTDAHAVIVPVLYGSGTRLKVIEAMAFRRPVVSTTAGAEGLPIRDGTEFFQADRPDEFVEALLKLAEQCAARDPALEQMLARARAAVEPLLWPRVVTDLTDSFLELVARSNAEAPKQRTR
jgi:glycosyltransferase involved in cell wall biosynthesis